MLPRCRILSGARWRSTSSEPARREPVVAGEASIDLTAEPEPAGNDLAPEAAPDSGTYRVARSVRQAVPSKGTSSPFDGTLNDMVEELHRKAREDVGNTLRPVRAAQFLARADSTSKFN